MGNGNAPAAKAVNTATAVGNQAVGVWGESTVWDAIYGLPLRPY